MTKRRILCECTDQLCQCKGICSEPFSYRLFRTDMADTVGIRFCKVCTIDAMNSGLFWTTVTKVQVNQDQI
jgi:hypothetical protein